MGNVDVGRSHTDSSACNLALAACLFLEHHAHPNIPIVYEKGWVWETVFLCVLE